MTAIDILGEDGLVAGQLPNYEVRPEQLDMAGAVAEAFEAGEHLIVEAGTGVGKSFAYLIPAIERAIAHGERVVISTHTIALQEQLINKDIPFLQSIMPDEFLAVLVKGRSNYLGLRRLTRASLKQEMLFDVGGAISELHAIEDWAYKTTDGSLADLPQRPSPGVWERVRSDSDDCLGRRCPHHEQCFYQRARRKAAAAQLLVVNHAMLFSDLAVRQQGASILPDYQCVVLDEAHTVERVAGDHLGLGIGSTQLRYLLNLLHNERTGKGMLKGGPGKNVVSAVREAHAIAGDYFDDLASWSGEQANWNGRLREPPPVTNHLSASLVDLGQRLRAVREETDDNEARLELESMMGRCAEAATAIDNWHELKTEDWVYWVDVSRGRQLRVNLNARPVDVGPILQESLFDPIRSVVLTSATLATSGDKPFAYLRGRIGLEDGHESALGSPFDYQEQLTVYIEAGLPDPGNSATYVPAACEAIKKYVLQSEGRAFVLFTSFDMLRRCAELLGDFFEENDMPLLLHGSGMNRSQMLDEFRAVPRSVLFGTDTFWAGVDVPGDSLSNVIIVKLPFAVPNHPMIEARIDLIKESGGNPFMQFQVPEAILKFKQGVGRLIRTRTDRGIVVILDPRVVSKPYGKRFLRALPECQVVVVRDGETVER